MIKTWFGENNYQHWRKVAIFFVIVYPIGVPLAFLGQLYANRNNLYETNDKGQVKKKHDQDTGRITGYMPDKATGKRIGMLYLSYKPAYWWWEVVDLVRKLTITGMIIFIMPGTPSQFAFGILLSLFFMMLFVGCRPYCDSTNSVLQTTAQIAVFLVLFSGLLISSQVSKDDGYDSAALEGVLVFVTIMPIVLGGAMIIYTMVTLFCADFAALCCKKAKKSAKGDDTPGGNGDEGDGSAKKTVVSMENLDGALAQINDEKKAGEA
jgi:hypothetical protein